MFDELQKEPEDVFAKTDESAPQMTPPTMSTPPVAPVMAPAPAPSSISPQPLSAQTEVSEKRAFPWKVAVLVVSIVVVVGLAFFLSMKILNSRTPVTPKAPEQSPVEEAVPEQVPAATIPVVTTPEEMIPVADETTDTDKDGLPDMRETQLGTDPANPDTDSDGLFDKEEVDVYKTNPLNPDTDGDTYLDGAEVKGGYNPNGAGKLLEIPQK